MKVVRTYDRRCFSVSEYLHDAPDEALGVDALFILTMTTSSRMPSVWDQLRRRCPAQKVFVFTNAGYKVCSKRLCKQRTDFDLLDAYKIMFEFALANDLHRILTVEDDFFWSSCVTDNVHFQRVRSFLDSHGNTMDHYFLGCVPLVSIPMGWHWRLYSAGGTHAVVHTERGMHTYLREYNMLCERCTDSATCTIDLYFTSFAIVYGYWRPLAYQTFPKTQMQKEAWPPVGAYLMNRFTDLDRHVHPWYEVFYCLQIIPVFIIFLLVLFSLRMCRNNLQFAREMQLQIAR